MAAVTVNTGYPVFNVQGAKRDQFYQINGSSGDTLTVGMVNVLIVNMKPNILTTYSVAGGTIPGTSIITFTSSAPFTNADVEVVGN